LDTTGTQTRVRTRELAPSRIFLSAIASSRFLFSALPGLFVSLGTPFRYFTYGSACSVVEVRDFDTRRRLLPPLKSVNSGARSPRHLACFRAGRRSHGRLPNTEQRHCDGPRHSAQSGPRHRAGRSVRQLCIALSFHVHCCLLPVASLELTSNRGAPA
jgi:hypothetical protein